MRAFAALMRARYRTGVAGTNRTCRGDISEHYDGRALDWMLNVRNPRQRAIANSVTAWLSRNRGVMARRFGLSYMIWNKRMWREYAPQRGWTRYSGSSPHTDHIHFSFSWDGAMKRTSWWTGRATRVVDVGPCRVFRGQYAPLHNKRRITPCRTRLRAAPRSPYRVAVVGQRSAQIRSAQRRLGVRADGSFGFGTFNRLVGWQRRARVPVTGVLDKATWVKLVRVRARPPIRSRPVVRRPVSRALVTRYTAHKRVVLRRGSRGRAVVVLQRALRLRPDGAFGARTRVAVVRFQARQRIPRNGVVSRRVWNRLEKRDFPLIAYRRARVGLGSRGRAVVVVQRVLKRRMNSRLRVDGRFGPGTRAGVIAVQRRARLKRTGVVNPMTWVALENRLMRR